MRSLLLSLWPALLLVGGCAEKATAPTPPPQPAPLHFVVVAAGGRHTCALEQAGGLWCWGNDDAGQLGTDSLRSTTVPVQVTGAPVFTSIYAVDDRSCGLTAANRLYCWGAGRVGQLGNGLRIDQHVPTPAADTFHFQQVSVGDSIGCGLVAADSAGYCWGQGVRGGLGNGLITDSARPGKRLDYPGMRYVTLAAGAQHGCAITDQGVTRCWGVNTRGQAGNGTRIGLGSPEPVSSNVAFTRLFAGAEHTCALTAAGAAYCWGRGDGGEVGNGALADALVPTPVAGGLAFTSLTLGAEHTCGLTVDRHAYCWGDNFQGRLGTGGPPVAQGIPAPVLTSAHFLQMSAGKLHTCAVADDGRIWCWGSGSFGQLGNDQVLSQALPVQVPR